jgi:hypothetical protein
MLPTIEWKGMFTHCSNFVWISTEEKGMFTLHLDHWVEKYVYTLFKFCLNLHRGKGYVYTAYSPLSGKVCLHLVLILLTYHWVERYVFTSFQVWIMLLNADWNISKRHNSCVWTCSQTCSLKIRNYTRHEWCMMKKNKHISSFLIGKIQLCSFSFLWVITLQMASFPQSDKHAMVTYIWFGLRFLWC